MADEVGAMDAEWRDDLAAKREWVRSHFTPEARSMYEMVEGKLRLVSTILASGWVEAAETLKLQALGVVFGDALAQRDRLPANFDLEACGARRVR